MDPLETMTPTDWPPRPGDTWTGPHSQIWHARNEHGHLVLIPEHIGSGTLYGGSDPDNVHENHGPLALEHRPEIQPTDWELTLCDAGHRAGNGWYQFVLGRLAEQDPTDPMVVALWTLVCDHSGPDNEHCPGCDHGAVFECEVPTPTVAECDVVRTVAQVWADHPTHPKKT